MCGIFGAISSKLNHAGEFYVFLDNLFIATQSRGEQASGFAAVTPNGFITDKINRSADVFVELSAEWRRLRKNNSLSLIGHTRFATNGSPHLNYNNHPFHGPRYSMVHNGGILNFKKIAAFNGFDLKTECDSEVILHFLEDKEHLSDGIEASLVELDNCSMMAVAVLDRSNGHVHLFRSDTNPTVLLYLRRWNAVVFASTFDIIDWAMEKTLGKAHGQYKNGNCSFLTTNVTPRYETAPYHHLEIAKNGKLVKEIDLTQEVENAGIPFGFSSFSAEDVSRFSGSGTTKYDASEETAVFEKCPHCGATNQKSSIDSDTICTWCYKVIRGCSTSTDTARHSTTLSDDTDEWDSDYSDKVRCLLPYEIRGVKRSDIVEALTHLRDPGDEEDRYDLNDYETANYLACAYETSKKKLDRWEHTTLSELQQMSRGEYLAYFDFISECVVSIK